MDRAVMDNLFTTQNWQQHFEKCIKEGLEVDSESYGDGWTLIHYAMEAENFEAAEWLIKNGANVNAQDNSGWTVLHCVVKSEIEFALAAEMPVLFQGAGFLVSNGADTNLKNNDDQTARDLAASYGEEIAALFDQAISA